MGIGKGTHLYCASLPGINRRLALLTEQVPITLCKLRAEDLRVAFHELEKEEFRDRHKMRMWTDQEQLACTRNNIP